MKLAIMQPYFFPYIGYFQLINAVDKFVIYDDVNYIKQGWINRNRILLDGKDHFLTLSLLNAGSYRLINEIEIGPNRHKLLKTIGQTYKKAPFFHEVFSLIEGILTCEENNLAFFLEISVRRIVAFLNIKTDLMVSSTIKKDAAKKGQDKVLEICEKMNAAVYVNAEGGQELYSKEIFNLKGIALKFIKSRPINYVQFNNEFVPGLSIIDVLMFNSKENVNKMLKSYDFL